MRNGALLVMLVAGLGLAGCGSSKPLNTTSATPAGSNGTVMLDPPLSVPPGFNAPPLEAAAATPQPTDADQTAPSQPTLGQMAMSQPSLAQAAQSQPTLGQTAGGQSTMGQAAGSQPAGGQATGGQSTLGQPNLGPPPLGQAAPDQSLTGQSLAGQSLTGQLTTGQAATDQPVLGQPGSMPAVSANGQTPGEQAFLQAAGASDVNPNIRAEIDASSRVTMDPAFVDKLVFGPTTSSANSAGVVIQRAKPGMLDTLF